MNRLKCLLIVVVASVGLVAASSDRVPDVTLPDLAGQPVALRALAGEVVVLNFWATWCAPCVKEMPEFVRLQNDYGERGVRLVGIAVEEDVDAVREFAEMLEVNYPTLVGMDEASDLGTALGNTVGALPFTVVVGRDGVIAHRHQGALSYEEAKGLVEEQLAKD